MAAVQVEPRRHGGGRGAVSVADLVGRAEAGRAPRHARRREAIGNPTRPATRPSERADGRTLVVRRVRTVGLLGRSGPSWFRLTFAGNRAARVGREFRPGPAWLVTGALGLFALAVVLLSLTIGATHRGPEYPQITPAVAANGPGTPPVQPVPAQPAPAQPASAQAVDTPAPAPVAGSAGGQAGGKSTVRRATRGGGGSVGVDPGAIVRREISHWRDYVPPIARGFVP